MANILAIDDEIPILELIKNGLQKDGHTVSTYPSVSQIPLEYLNRYDLIMLDILICTLVWDFISQTALSNNMTGNLF